MTWVGSDMMRFVLFMTVLLAATFAHADITVRYATTAPTDSVRLLVVQSDGTEAVNATVPVGAPNAAGERQSIIAADLARGIEYTATLFALNRGVESAASNALTFTLPAAPDAPMLRCIIIRAEGGELILRIPEVCPQ